MTYFKLKSFKFNFKTWVKFDDLDIMHIFTHLPDIQIRLAEQGSNFRNKSKRKENQKKKKTKFWTKMKCPVRRKQTCKESMMDNVIEFPPIIHEQDTYFFTFHSCSGCTYGIAKKYGPRS